jgi:hypothetical protein
MQLLRLCIIDPCPIILIFIFMREKKLFGSSISVFVIRCHGKHFPRNVFNYKKKMKIALYQRGHYDLQVCQVSRNYLSYFQSYGNFSAIFCIFVTFSVPYLHIKTLQWICPESSRIADLKNSTSRKLLNQFWPNKLH